MSKEPGVLACDGQDAWGRSDWVDRLVVILILAGVCATAITSVSGRLIDPVVDTITTRGWQGVMLRPSLLWLAMGALLLAVRTILWLRYRPFPHATQANAPAITVVIPAYNEGAMVAKTIDSVASARYPHARLEIVAIDDGSRDDTWAHIEAAARRHPGRVQTLRFPVNRGKRAALAEGFRRARGEIVVTIDSDSVVEPDTLLAIAGPFRDPKVGAVAGKVSVFNRFEGLIPRMLHVRFVLSFDFLRSVQSTFRTVYCCPGALSAYRREAVLRVLPRWESQSFLGATCTIGEDRALTNDILALGLDAVYQRTAVVHTIVPRTYGKLARMYLRWDRSYIREELRFARIVWKRPPRARLIALFEQTLTNLRYPVAYASLGLLLALSWEDPWTIVRVLLSIGLASAFYMLYFLRSERSWEFVYGIAYAFFAFFTLLWVFPYALLTVRSRSWLTR